MRNRLKVETALYPPNRVPELSGADSTPQPELDGSDPHHLNASEPQEPPPPYTAMAELPNPNSNRIAEDIYHS